MAKTAYRVRNWRDYNKALVQRGSLTVWFSGSLLSVWQSPPATGGRGRPEQYSEPLLVAALTLRQLFHLPLRATEGLLQSLVALMHVKAPVPDYTTLSKRGQRLTVNLGVRNTGQARHVLVDATGVQVVGEGEWKQLLHGKTRCQVWRKLHLAMDAKEQTILAAEVSESVRLDGNSLPRLIAAVPDPIAQVTGDGAYDKKNCYRVAYERGAKAVFPPQRDARAQRNKHKKEAALLPRDNVIAFLGRGADRAERLKQWKQATGYHRRSLIETLMSRLKAIFGDRVSARSWANQQTD